MKVTITNLKAPWPAGARLGAVVEVGDTMPGCLVGKCRPAEPGAHAEHVYQPALPTPVLAETKLEPQRDFEADLHLARQSLLAAEAALAAERETSAELRAKLADAEAALAARPAGKAGKA